MAYMDDEEHGDGWPDMAADWDERLATDEIEDWEEAFMRGYEEDAREMMEAA